MHLREKRLSLTDPFTEPLAGALQAYKARFPHGGPGVEKYLKEEPNIEWTSKFVKLLCKVLLEMARDTHLQDDEDQLVKRPPLFQETCPSRSRETLSGRSMSSSFGLRQRWSLRLSGPGPYRLSGRIPG